MKKLDVKALTAVKGGTFSYAYAKGGHDKGGYDKGGYGHKKSGKHC